MTAAISSYAGTSTSSRLAVSGPCHLAGLNLHEGGTASSTVNVRDGLTAGGALVMTVPLALGESQKFRMWGARFSVGVFLELSGTGIVESTVIVDQG
jgi:hypothetical protein